MTYPRPLRIDNPFPNPSKTGVIRNWLPVTNRSAAFPCPAGQDQPPSASLRGDLWIDLIISKAFYFFSVSLKAPRTVSPPLAVPSAPCVLTYLILPWASRLWGTSCSPNFCLPAPHILSIQFRLLFFRRSGIRCFFWKPAFLSFFFFFFLEFQRKAGKGLTLKPPTYQGAQRELSAGGISFSHRP